MQYSTGTLALTNGSAAVTGTGTAWVGGLRAGWLLLVPGEGPLLVESVASNTALTLARPYQGSTRSGVAYNAIATRGEMTTFLTQLQTVLTAMQGTIDGAGAGKFADGTMAIPGMRFISDEDTGMRRTAANALALVTGGADRLKVTNAGAELTGLLTGTAVTQSATDATAGRLMRVGDFGLGGAGASPAITLNSATAQGLYQYSGTDPNSPSGANGGVVLVQRHATTFIIQTAHRANDFQEFTRFSTDNGATWSAWSRSFSQRSILGTVSQSSGVPTGAVIERGSNANGEYVRFADGLQICRTVAQTMDVATAVGSVFRGIGTAANWPAAFSVVPFVVHQVSDSNVTQWGGPQANSTATQAVLRLFSATSVTGIAAWSLGIGRWF